MAEHGAASACVAPLSACAMELQGGWRSTALLVELGHDSSCALSFVDGVRRGAAWTPRGGAAVADCFKGLVAMATPDAAGRKGSLSDPARQHDVVLLKKRFAEARSAGAPVDSTARGTVPLPNGADAPVAEEAQLCGEVLFCAADACPVPRRKQPP